MLTFGAASVEDETPSSPTRTRKARRRMRQSTGIRRYGSLRRVPCLRKSNVSFQV
jgi:hypothetical protein